MVMPFGFSRSFGVFGRSQAVSVKGQFEYKAMPRLDYVGDEALVSFEDGDGTLEVCGVDVVRGASGARLMGRIVRLSGLECGRSVLLELRLAEGCKQVNFVFG